MNLEALGIIGLSLDIPSPSYRVLRETIDGRPGEIITDKTLDVRQLLGKFILESDGYVNSLTSRNKLFEVFGNGETVYVSESHLSTIRWKCHVDGWVAERVNSGVHLFEIPLLAESGTSETVNIVEKSYSTESFRFKNEGNVSVDPRIHSETVIEFKGVSTNLTILNQTTSDQWSLTGSTVTDDVIRLEGVKTLKNGLSVFGQTNKKLITLKPGWNDFQITGATGSFTVTVRTRFYFL